MKKISIICEWIIFWIFSIYLLLDFGGLRQCDTCLFYLGGHSVGLQAHEVTDLSPLFVGIIYLIGLIFIILSIKLLHSYLAIYIVNTIYAVLLLMFFKPYLLDYPPFGLKEEFVIPIFMYIINSYFAILLFLLSGIYFLHTKLVHK